MNYYSQIKWVDDYIKNVSPYIYVREEDSIIIKIPNQAFKINKDALKIMKILTSGNSVFSIIDKYPDKEAVSRDLHNFFCDLRSILKGCYNENEKRLAVEKIPFTLSFNTLPVLSELAVTYKCNLACRFCYASCGCTKGKVEKELSTQKLKDIISIIRNEAKVPSISFTGGEPLLRDDLPQLIKHAKGLGMWTNLITNGTLMTKDKADNLKKAGLDSVQISLEAADEGLHDYIVDKKGAFNKTIAGIKTLIDSEIRVHTNTTITNLNKDYLKEILLIVKDLKLDKFSMNMLMPEGSALNNLDEVLVKYSQIGDIVLEIQTFAKSLNLTFMWYSPTPVCMFNPIAHGLGNKGCAACDGLLSITPLGDILPCSSYPKPMGNILKLKGKFNKAWNMPEFNYFREKMFAHKICQDCSHLAVCNGGCPLYWKKVGIDELMEVKQRGGIN